MLFEVQQKEKNTKEIIKLGIEMASKLLDVKEPNVSYLPIRKATNQDVSAVYIPETNTISYNKTWLDQSSEVDILAATFHEVRHAYQYEMEKAMLKGKEVAEIELVKKWKEERSLYQVPLIGKHPQVHYLNQEIEIDAVAFAHLVMRTMFGMKSHIPLSVKTKVQHRMKEILLLNTTLQKVAKV